MGNALKSASHSVLVVDNEPFIREAVEDILDSIGINVFSAEDGHEGIATYLSNKDKIDLVILDMRLPGLTGAEILRMLRSINPLVKVIVASGYDEQEIQRQLKGQPTVSILRKPYNADVLLSTVRAELSH
jgi:two-component system, cell cycle sensor histidine kinase and response regulator CckA